MICIALSELPIVHIVHSLVTKNIKDQKSEVDEQELLDEDLATAQHS